MFHPLFMPIIGFVLMYVFAPYMFSIWSVEKAKQTVLAMFIVLVFIPALSTFLMARLEFIESVFMHKREDRIMPLISSMIFYLWITYTMKFSQPPLLFFQMMVGATISLVVAFLINLKIKISLHTIGAGNLLAIILFIIFKTHYQVLWLLVLGLLVAGWIGTSRLILNAHSKTEVVLGYIIGFLSQIIAFFLLYKII